MNANSHDLYNATVVGREEINPQLVILRVRPDAEMFEFKPGQFGVLGMLGSAPRVAEAAPEEPPSEPDKLIRRAYSIASTSLERRYAEFYLTLIASGQLTPVSRAQSQRHLHPGPRAPGQGRGAHRHRHRPGSVRVHAPHHARGRRPAAVCGAAWRAP
jgi:ferredoxin--NADP+ reductase